MKKKNLISQGINMCVPSMEAFIQWKDSEKFVFHLRTSAVIQ